MIHGILFAVGLFMIAWGIVICAMLITMSLKTNKAMLLVTIPGILIVAVLALNFSCHLFHWPRNIIPHQIQIVSAIHWTLRLLIVPLLLIRVYEWWLKRRARVASQFPSSTCIVLGCFSLATAFLSSAAQAEAKPMASHVYRVVAQAKQRSVIDYFNLLPWLGIGYQATRQEKCQLLQAESHPIIDGPHDYLSVHPDSSPAEQIAVFRTRHKSDVLAVSLPDFQSDYNNFTLFRLHNGKLRDVTDQMLPSADTDRYLYELPRFGTTIRVFRFDIDRQSRRHVFDLQWRGGRFVKVRSAACKKHLRDYLQS